MNVLSERQRVEEKVRWAQPFAVAAFQEMLRSHMFAHGSASEADIMEMLLASWSVAGKASAFSERTVSAYVFKDVGVCPRCNAHKDACLCYFGDFMAWDAQRKLAKLNHGEKKDG